MLEPASGAALPVATMASRIRSDTPASFSAISASARRSSADCVERSLATITDSGSPALVMATTDSLVITSCARAGPAHSPAARTRAGAISTRREASLLPRRSEIVMSDSSSPAATTGPRTGA
ncbi:MAG: hypothetical protein A2X52_16015 [Candidatus Rokubacteria bacterium GWC2_70_16]|nr:MAG: hypothetical protein A2X52_16015 [Candidatus Rokubacteria bacterium GWC2_70_16]